MWQWFLLFNYKQISCSYSVQYGGTHVHISAFEMLNLWYNQGQLESEMNIPPQKNAITLKFHFILEEALRLYVTCQKTYALPSRISYLILSVSLSSYHQLGIFLIFFIYFY